MYAELIGNYKKQRIKNLYDNKLHLLEYGHEKVVNPGKGRGNGRGVIPGRGIGRNVGFQPGYKVMEKGAREFEEKREDVNEISKALDKLLSDNRL